MKTLESELAEARREVSRTPSYLYKYVGVEGAKLDWLTSNIENSTLYFSTRAELNDPYEFGVYPSFRATEEEIRRWCDAQLDPNDIGSGRYEARVAELVEATRNPEQAAYEVRKYRQVQDRTTAILSLTEVPDNLAMWSYYAEGHKGACLILNTSIDVIAAFAEKPVPYPIQVSYQSKMPSFRFFLVSNAEYRRLSMGTKTKAMSHEREWRLVHPTKHKLVAVPEGMICGLILGAKTAQSVRARLVDSCQAATYPILLYEAALEEDQYGITIRASVDC